MNDPELREFEAELQKLKPAVPPEHFEASLLLDVRRGPACRQIRPGAAFTRPVEWFALWRWWFAPALGMAMLVAAIMLAVRHEPGAEAQQQQYKQPGHLAKSDGASVARASEDVEIDRELLASYETVAEVAERGPVRFRCEEWEDRVVFRDPGRGISIESRTPRIEVVPVRFESY